MRSARYQASPNDFPVATDVDQASNYGGVQASLNANVRKNDIQAGVYGFAQRQSNNFNNQFTDGTPNFPPSSASLIGGLEEIFVSDKFKVTPWLTLIAGFRQSHFTADIVENEVEPRVGIAVKIPRMNWVFRAFYGHFYQPPPLLTATGSLLALQTARVFLSLLSMANGMKSISLALRFHFAAGFLTQIIFRHGRRIGWIITILEHPISSGRSRGMRP